VAFAYDEVPYDTEANVDTHPVAMATIAHLAGLPATPARRARVLEIGCGDGGNLGAMAAYLPEARFVGFDLAARAIEEGKKHAPPNVELSVGDIAKVHDLGEFDYVIAHGIYSWVPVREELLRLMRTSLAPNGIGFLSFNAMPGWRYRGSLRELMRDRTRNIESPAEKVKTGLAVVDEIARGGAGAPGYLGALATHAHQYLEHVARATPPESPYSYYVFHDLLADINDAFSYSQMESALAATGLRIISETPLGRTPRDELPFLQVLIQRDDGPVPSGIESARAGELFLWADLAPLPQGFGTSTGAVVRPPPESGLARAAAKAPGFVKVQDLDPDPRFAAQVLDGFREGVFVLRSEPPALPSELPDYTRSRAARSLLMTSALHRSYRVVTADVPRERLHRLAFTGTP
jgi:SAM-dependent methyltransferase